MLPETVKIGERVFSAPKFAFDAMVNGERNGINLSVKNEDGFESSEYWLNKSKSGKALTLKIDGDYYIVATSQLFRKSLQFSKIIN